MKHPLVRAALAAGAAAAIAVGVIFVTSNNSSATAPQLAGWAGTWTAGLVGPSPADVGGSLTGFTNQSIRMIVHTSLGGDNVRLRFSNQFGAQAMTIGHATVGLPVDAAGGSPDVQAGTIHELTFNGGGTSATVYKGADVVTDTLNWHVKPNSNLAVTIFLPTATGPATWHPGAMEFTFIYDGDVTGVESVPGGPSLKRQAFYFLAAVDVKTLLPAGDVVVMGDSISNGNGSTFDGNTRWPDMLSLRINHDHNPFNEGVLNQSMAGNAVTHDGSEITADTFGVSGLARLSSEAFAEENVKTVIVELGVNDINFYGDNADRIIAGLQQLAIRIKEHNLNAVVLTIGPFGGFAGPPGWSPTKESVRSAVNAWIRSQHEFDYVIDMDKILRDPADPTQLLPKYDFDGIHPNDAGAQALVNAIDLSRL